MVLYRDYMVLYRDYMVLYRDYMVLYRDDMVLYRDYMVYMCLAEFGINQTGTTQQALIKHGGSYSTTGAHGMPWAY